MALVQWVNIAVGSRDEESPVGTTLIDGFHQNQEALCTQPIDCRWDEFSEDTTFPASITREIFIPESAATTDGNIKLVVRFEKKVVSGTTGQVRVTLGAGTPVTSASFTNTTYDTVEITISTADTRTVAGTNATLTIELLRSAGSGFVYSQNVNASSRLERQV